MQTLSSFYPLPSSLAAVTEILHCVERAASVRCLDRSGPHSASRYELLQPYKGDKTRSPTVSGLMHLFRQPSERSVEYEQWSVGCVKGLYMAIRHVCDSHYH